MSHIFASTAGGSATEIIVVTILIAASSIAYIVWLVKRKL
jgi:hypothetical protein